jgi:general L-amino acid transport system substrate-binding protein
MYIRSHPIIHPSTSSVISQIDRNFMFQPLTRDMFAFSTPYMYSGLRFAGEEDFVVCAETPGSAGARFCDQTVICVSDSTTHLQTIQAMNPDLRLSLTLSATESIERFIAGTCNVIAGEPYQISEFQVRKLGYTGSSYYTGEGTFSKDPLAMATRSNDPKWSDFVNWVLQALLRAEEKGIDQASAFEIPTTNVFGEEYENMFVNAVDVVGNYAEIYERNLELVLPRQSQDQINSGTSGLLYSYPFGDVTEPGSGPTLGGTIDAIRSRGILHCGVSTRAIFANFDSLRESWSGFDVDFCRAIAAALFDGDHTKVIFTDLPASVRFFELQQGAVDVLSRITTVTLERDVREPNVGVGFSFSQPTFYDGMTFGGVPQFVDCADNLDVGQESFICRNLVICVNRDTTFEKRVNELFADAGIRVRDSLSQSILSLAVGECNVIAGGSVDVSVTSITSSNLYSGEYAVGVNRFSKDPLALVTRQDDFQWTQFVNWIVQALIYAEENGINQDTAGEMPLVEFFGPDFSRMFQHAVAAVGNYAELYDRNAGGDIERGGLNTLNVLLSGPQHYPFPGVI